MRVTVGLIALVAILSPAAAQDGPAPAADAPKGYVRTSETRDCVRPQTIRSIEILNERQALFKMAGGVWLQEPIQCPPLHKLYAFNFKATLSQICASDPIRVVDTRHPVTFVGTCTFRPFQKLTRKSAAAD